MGVSTHFFAFDPRVYAAPTMDRWFEDGELSEEMEPVGEATGRLVEVPTLFSDNKKWYRNLAGDFAWSVARKRLTEAERAPLDRWLSHFFWQAPEGQGCPCGVGPRQVADQEVVYSPELLAHIASLETPLWPADNGLTDAFGGDSPDAERLHYPWIYDPEGFAWLVQEWRDTLAWPLQKRPGWHLLRWVWL